VYVEREREREREREGKREMEVDRELYMGLKFRLLVIREQFEAIGFNMVEWE
jgi:hypothetical protein